MYVDIITTVLRWRSDDNLGELPLSFYHVDFSNKFRLSDVEECAFIP